MHLAASLTKSITRKQAEKTHIKESCRITCQTVFLYLMKTMPCNKLYFQAQIKACRITELSRWEGTSSNLLWEEEHRWDQHPDYTLLKTSSNVPREAVPRNGRGFYKYFLSYVKNETFPSATCSHHPWPCSSWWRDPTPQESHPSDFP